MEKIKQFLDSDKGKDIMIVFIVILVGLGCFELGRLSKNTPEEGIKIQNIGVGDEMGKSTVESLKSVKTNILEINQTLNRKIFFASSKGNKYYLLGCAAGKTIKQENRIWFATREEAERAGYGLSSSCS